MLGGWEPKGPVPGNVSIGRQPVDPRSEVPAGDDVLGGEQADQGVPADAEGLFVDLGHQIGIGALCRTRRSDDVDAVDVAKEST